MSKLEEVKADYLAKYAELQLRKAGVDDVDKYLKYVDAVNEEGIGKQARAIAGDINRKPVGVDPQVSTIWKPFK